jgi:hypothetical protein
VIRARDGARGIAPAADDDLDMVGTSAHVIHAQPTNQMGGLMRRLNRIITLCACTAAVASTALSAQTGPSVSGELAFRSKYLFAGIPFAAHEVQQATVTVAAGSFSFNAFSVYDFDASDVTEADLYADYYVQAAPTVGVFVGGALYNFKISDQWEGTPEVFGGITFSAPLRPTLYVAHDFDLGEGTHAMLSLSHSVPLGASGLTLDLGGDIDYNAEYYTADSGLSFWDLSAAVGIPVGPATISPMFLVQRRLDDVFVGFVPDEELFGVTASMTF